MEKACRKTKKIFINERTLEKGVYSLEEETADFLLMRTDVIEDKKTG